MGSVNRLKNGLYNCITRSPGIASSISVYNGSRIRLGWLFKVSIFDSVDHLNACSVENKIDMPWVFIGMIRQGMARRIRKGRRDRTGIGH